MNLRSHALVSQAVFAIACATILSATTLADEPFVTKSNSFRLPFEMEAAEDQPVQGYAVLFASHNEGPWRQIQRMPLSAGGFQFSAPSDGLWEFDIRMTDRAGVPDPADGPLSPSMRVMVDTQAPTIDLDLIDAGQGDILLRWNCAEEISDGSLKLEYSEAHDGRWRPLNVPAAVHGETTIHTRGGVSITVRGTVSDKAGNTGNARREIVTAIAPVAEQASPQPARATAAPASLPPVGQMPFLSTPNHHPHTRQPGTEQASPQSITAPASQAPAFTPAPTYPAHNTMQAPAAGQTYRPMPPATAAPAAPQWKNPYSTVAATSTSAPMTAPGQPVTQLVSGPVFNLDYAVDDIGPSGISSVELFLTEDGGQQWFRYGNDNDVKSPVSVDVQGDGTFGFAIRVRNGVGFVDPPPQPGDRPEIVVTVDQNAPQIDLAVPQVQIHGNAAIRLQWNVQDVHATAVRLEWSTAAGGPWNPVFEWQPDQGGFDWPIQPNSPHSVHFRLLARDAAGNIGTAQTAQPVLIDLKRPRARMIGVQPANRF